MNKGKWIKGENHFYRIHRSFAGGLVIFAVAYIVVEIGLKTPRNLISLGGMAALVTFTFMTILTLSEDNLNHRIVFIDVNGRIDCPAAVNITLIGSFLLLFSVKLPLFVSGIFMIGSIRVQND
jgi:hypothetical protein